VKCVAVTEAVNIRYKLTGPRSGTAAALLAAICDKSNWEGGASRYNDYGTFTLGAPGDDPDIQVTASLNFGAIPANTTTSDNVQVTNNGASANLNILATNLGGANPGKFSVTTSPLPTGIIPGASANLTVQFDPAGEVGVFTADLGIQRNDPSDPWTTVTLSGTGAPSSPLILSQIMYNPSSPEPDWEWVEVYNPSGSPVSLAGYVLDDNDTQAHVAANIAAGSVPAGGVAYLYNADAISEAAFKLAWGNVNAVAVTGWMKMQLSNSGDRVGLWENFSHYAGDHQTHALAADSVTYDDVSGWPADDGFGAIYVTTLAGDRNLGASWKLAVSADAGNATVTGGLVKKSNTSTNNTGLDWASIIAGPATGAPAVADAYSTNSTTVVVVFDKDVDQTTAEVAGNYELSDGAETSAFATATRDASDKKVVYLSGPTNPNLFDDITSDILTVNNVQPDGLGDPAVNSQSSRFYAGVLPIQLIQQNALSPSAKLTVRGIVTADEEDRQVWIADAPGAWNGIQVYDVTGTIGNLVNVSDDVTITGSVTEYFGLTEIQYPALLAVHSTMNPLYTPPVVTCADLDSTFGSNTAPAESFESVLVTLNNATIVSGSNINY